MKTYLRWIFRWLNELVATFLEFADCPYLHIYSLLYRCHLIRLKRSPCIHRPILHCCQLIRLKRSPCIHRPILHCCQLIRLKRSPCIHRPILHCCQLIRLKRSPYIHRSIILLHCCHRNKLKRSVHEVENVGPYLQIYITPLPPQRLCHGPVDIGPWVVHYDGQRCESFSCRTCL